MVRLSGLVVRVTIANHTLRFQNINFPHTGTRDGTRRGDPRLGT